MKLYQFPLCLVAVLLLTLFLLPAQNLRAADKPQWIPLFNGKNLDGWTPKFKGCELGVNYKNTFRVEDGLLKVVYDQYDHFEKNFGHLFYKTPFSHYRLRAEYRFVGDQVDGGPAWAVRNNGIMIHGQTPESMGVDQSFPVSIEVQLLGGLSDGKPRPTANVCSPGTHYVHDGKLVKRHTTESVSKTYDGDQWVTVEVEVHGNDRIRHFVNGELVFDYEKPQLDPKAKDAKKLIEKNGDLPLHKGTISIQAESHPTEFRKIEILPLSENAEVRFEKTHIDPKFRSEGVAVADFSGDGLADIAVGSVYYAAPDWKMMKLYGEPAEYDVNHYGDTFGAAAEDVDRDGDVDFIQLPWPGKAMYWWENPGRDADGKPKDQPWKKHLVVSVLNNESPVFADVDGDGLGEAIGGWAPDPENVDGPERRVAIIRRTADPFAPWQVIDVSERNHPSAKRYGHGFGVGDVNGDGRNDIVTTYGWWEQPAGGLEGKWISHPHDFCNDDPHHGSHIQIYDFDEDGDADLFVTSAHKAGTWWFEQTAPDKWTKHTLDTSVTQQHAVCLLDVNEDGRPDIVTGKRWWAHGGRDPGSGDPAVMLWWENGRDADGKIVWRKHVFDENSGVGTHFTVADVDGDGRVDVITSNKKGVHLFLRKP